MMQNHTQPTSLGNLLNELTVEGQLYAREDDTHVRCLACGHKCRIAEGKSGICKVRFNRDGKLFVPHGYVVGLHADPIEKKPLFHALPGSTAMSFGMLGCNLHCDFCQNWITSQTLRDPAAGASPQRISAEQIVALSRQTGCSSITSTYNEPLITSEWSVAIFRLAKQAGLATGYVSNGHASPEVIDYLHPWLDWFKVDLKSFQEKNYRQLGGVLQNVLDTIRRLHTKGFWVEVVTLVVPGFNDSPGELRDIARFLVSISADIPWHVTAFHADYRMHYRENTTARHLIQAANIGKEEGLRFVYAGNLPGRTRELENTHCPECNALLIERWGFRVLQNNLKDGKCHKCGASVPGRWKAKRNEAKLTQ